MNTYQAMKAIECDLHQSGLSTVASSLIWTEVFVGVDIIVCGSMSTDQSCHQLVKFDLLEQLFEVKIITGWSDYVYKNS